MLLCGIQFCKMVNNLLVQRLCWEKHEMLRSVNIVPTVHVSSVISFFMLLRLTVLDFWMHIFGCKF